jgi:hypothetical protein
LIAVKPSDSSSDWMIRTMVTEVAIKTDL